LTVRLFLTGKSLPNHVEAVFDSRWLPPKAAVSAYGHHSFVEGIRNGGLDLIKTVNGVKSKNRRTESSAPQTVFFFPRPGQIIFYVAETDVR